MDDDDDDYTRSPPNDWYDRKVKQSYKEPKFQYTTTYLDEDKDKDSDTSSHDINAPRRSVYAKRDNVSTCDQQI